MGLQSFGSINPGSIPTSGNVNTFSFPFVRTERAPSSALITCTFTGGPGTGGTGIVLQLQRFSVDLNASTTLFTMTRTLAANGQGTAAFQVLDTNLGLSRMPQGLQYVLNVSQAGSPTVAGTLVEASISVDF